MVEEVEIEVDHCGVGHSELSMLDNAWGISTYSFVPGHVAMGRVVALGEVAKEKGLRIGQRVGIGWDVKSSLHCPHCLREPLLNRQGRARRIDWSRWWLNATALPAKTGAEHTGPNPLDRGKSGSKHLADLVIQSTAWA